MKSRPFKQVDVFTDTPYLGNPLAVVLDASDLSDEQMAHFAQWTNLSETTFLLPPSPPAALAGADYQVRIFTPGGELPFAGHPTLGSCHAWLQAGGVPKVAGMVVQECKQGLIRIQQAATGPAFAAPPLKQSAPDATLLAAIVAALGLQANQVLAAQLLDNGPQWLSLLIDSSDVLLALTPDHAQLKAIGYEVGIAAVNAEFSASSLIARSNREARAFSGIQPPADTTIQAASVAQPALLEVRAFAASVGVNEDPVTGSLNASLAQWLMAQGHVPDHYIAAQGVCLGRSGRVHLSRDASGQVWVGGASVTCIDGVVNL
jgi:PhzF family phenazine biosynthesis protein